MPWGDGTHITRDFLSHLRLRHRFEYAVVADFDADEEAMLRRALSASAREAGVDEEEDLQRVLRESALEAGMQDNDEDEDDDEEDETDPGRKEHEEVDGSERRLGDGEVEDDGDEEETFQEEVRDAGRSMAGLTGKSQAGNAAKQDDYEDSDSDLEDVEQDVESTRSELQFSMHSMTTGSAENPLTNGNSIRRCGRWSTEAEVETALATA